ncbi:hypothetical protein LIER_01824 [Lithospermum erythrorhizon]|uniref:Reverse transcriptase/retrotransposon-derived protein RNase H-like domain-containing protein n=1 Tax=Lithospermum erythrorhizon TaxID=34254 RepID=A0AAV3NN22_LITER
MCTDFTNLNKACPKDYYPLPCLGSEFEINNAPRARIKAQVLADFIVENITRKVDEVPIQERTLEEAPRWTLYVDGASNDKGVGAGILIQGVNGEQFKYALRFSFKATNNKAVRRRKLGAENVEIRKSPAYEDIAIMRVMEEEEDWRSPITRFILTSELPSDGVETRKSRAEAISSR